MIDVPYLNLRYGTILSVNKHLKDAIDIGNFIVLQCMQKEGDLQVNLQLYCTLISATFYLRCQLVYTELIRKKGVSYYE